MGQLTSEERRLCRLIAETVTVNHFSDRRKELDAEIGGCSVHDTSEERLGRMLIVLEKLIRQLEKKGGVNPMNYTGEDRMLVERLFFFNLFHQYMHQFDSHIEDQLASPEKIVPLSCGSELMTILKKNGYSQKESANYIAVMFQLRRAYYFIARQLKGECPSMIRFREQLWNNVFTTDLYLYFEHLLGRMEEYATLILGPTGTGKGAAASAIGKSGYIPFSPRTSSFEENFQSSFIGINLSQYPENLIESELFGHRKGAFTGAMEAHTGIFDQCSAYGSILLDEIGDVSTPVQIKLLKVIQERQFSPVGSHKAHRFRGRVIAATNRDLNQLRAEEMFRDDFYYRLCSDTIVVPSLAQRISEDENELPLMVNHLVAQIVGEPVTTVVDRVLSSIEQEQGMLYTWPGNVRELEQCVRSVIVGGRYLGDAAIGSDDPVIAMLNNLDNPLTAEQLLSRYCKELYARLGTYDAVGKMIKLDRRTVKKYVDSAKV